MIIFKKIRFKNFVSTGNNTNEIVLSEHERTLVSSSNGEGKSSSCIDSIVFALYGKAHRNIRKDQLINSTNEKDLLVELWFCIGTNEYKIERGLKPNIFEIYINDVKQNSLSNVKDMQAFLENDILKMNYTAFANVAILGASAYIPFMEQPIATRRLLVEELLDINIFGTMLVVLKERIKLVNNEIKDFNGQIISINKQIEIQQRLIGTIKANNQSATINNSSKITELEQSILELNKDIQSLTDRKTTLTAEQEQLIPAFALQTKLNTYISSYNTKIKDLSRTLSFYTKNTTCPTCSQELNIETKDSNIITCNKSISDLTTGLTLANKKLDACNIQIQQHKTIQAEISKIDSQIYSKHNEINLNKKRIKEYQLPVVVDLDKLASEETNLSTLQSSVAQYVSDLTDAKKDLENYQVVNHMLSDGGIKSKIIDKYLPIFNNYINNYLSQFGVYINFVFDNTFKEYIKSRHRDSFSYSSFSEGEKIKISLAIMLAFRDLARVKNSVNTNLLIMDEIFDSSLDYESNKNLMNVLRGMQDTNIIIISHRNDLNEDDFSRTLLFKKVNNFTEISSNVS